MTLATLPPVKPTPSAIPETPEDLASAGSRKGQRQREFQLKEILRALGKAEFPRDLPKFKPWVATLSLETKEGRRRRSLLVKGHEAAFLLTLALDLVRARAAPWFRAQDIYHDPALDAAIDTEPAPLRRRQLRQRQKKQQADAVDALREALTHECEDANTYAKLFAKADMHRANPPFKFSPKARDRRRDRAPLPGNCEPTNWAAPMTIAAYMQAVGRSRPTIHDFLAAQRLRSQPRPSVTAPALYDPAVNLRVFRQWLACWCRRNRALDLAADAVALAEVHAPDFAPLLQRAAIAALRQRELWDASAFAAAVQEHRPLYAPPPPPPPNPWRDWVHTT